MNVEELLKRRDKVNLKIDFITEENRRKESEINNLIVELNDMGVKATRTNLKELLEKYQEDYEKQLVVLEDAVTAAEKIMGR